MSTTVRTLARRLPLPALLLLAIAALGGTIAARPLHAQLVGTYKESGVGDATDGGGEASLATRICGYGKMQICALEATKSCAEWSIRQKFNITLTGFGVEYEVYCISETTLTRYYYRDV